MQIYAARSGVLEAECPFTVGRSYGFFGAYDFDGDGKSEFLVMADVPKHLNVLGYRNGKLSVLSRHEIELGVEDPVKMLRFIPEPVGDFDGDHIQDVVANTFNDTNDGKWHLVVRDGISGRVKLDLVDEIAQGVDDLNEDGIPELLTISTSGRHVPDYATIRVRSVKGNRIVAIWQCDNAGWQCQQTPRPLHQQCYNHFSRHGALVRHIQGGAQVVVRKKVPDAVDEIVLSMARWQGDGFKDVATVCGKELQAIGINDRGATLFECQLAPDEEQRLSIVGGAATCLASAMPVLRPRVPIPLTEHKSKPARSQHIPPLPALETPIVVRDGPLRKPYVATQGSGGEVVVFRPPLRERGATEVWRQRGYGAIGASLQGDDRRQLIFATASPKSHAVMTAVNVADGASYWRREFPNFSGGSPAWNLGGPLYWHVGHFTADRPQDLLVTLRREIHHSDETFLLSGKDGSELWHRPRQISDRGCGGQRFAIADFNGDGLDDAANCFPSIHYILDGPTGRNQIAADNQWPEVPIKSVYWVQPIAGDFDQSGKTSLLLGSTGSHMIGRLQVDGKLAWSAAYDEAGNCYPAIGDFDGNGRRDALFTGFSDGTRCYDTANGKVNWTLPIAQDRYVESVVSADLDGDGRDEAVFSLDDTLYCVGATTDGRAGEVRWKLSFPERISSPAIADVGEADEKIEASHQGVSKLSILVAAEDGYVYGIQ